MDLRVVPANQDLVHCRAMVVRDHYLHTIPDPRTRPLCYAVKIEGRLVGCLFFGRPESTRCFKGSLTYGSLGDVSSGRAAYDRWEVLNLARVWLSPDVQPGGQLHGSEHLPGFVDRRGAWRSTLASEVIRLALARVGHDYLVAHPPCFVEQPYQIRVVLSYCDTRRHRGVIYRAAGFALARTNGDGIETWWTSAVARLTAEQDAELRELAATNPRSVRIRRRNAGLQPLRPAALVEASA